MKRTILYIFLIILFFVTSPFAQSDYKIELNGGRITSAIQSALLPYWDTGWSLGFTASKKLSKDIELTSSFSYQNFKFQKAFVIFPPNIDPPGLLREISGGENSNVYNFSLGVRITSSTKRLTNFFSFSGGIQYINQGEIFITRDYNNIIAGNFLPISNTSLYNSSNRNYLMSIVSIGAGLTFKIISKINLIVEGKLISTLKDFTTYPNISTGIQYSF